MPRQGRDRLLASGRGVRVDHGEHAPGAALRRAEQHGPDPHHPPAVLVEGRRVAGQHEAGPEPHHRQRPLLRQRPGRDPLIQLDERCLASQQQRVAVRERDAVRWVAVLGVDRPPGRIVQVDQPHWHAQVLAEPWVRIYGRHGEHLALKQPHRYQRPASKCPQPRHARRRRLDDRAVGPWRDKHERRVLARRDHIPGPVDQHPPPVTGQTPRFHVGCL